MSQAEIERFVEDLKTDEGLRAELADHASGIGSVVAFAGSKGYEITEDEASAYINAQAGRDLSDDELDAVAGGKTDAGPAGSVTTSIILSTTAQAAWVEAVIGTTTETTAAVVVT